MLISLFTLILGIVVVEFIAYGKKTATRSSVPQYIFLWLLFLPFFLGYLALVSAYSGSLSYIPMIVLIYLFFRTFNL